MTQIVTSKWAAVLNGDWGDGADWTPSGPPDNTAAFDFNVFIGGSYTVGTGAFTVTSSANRTIGFLDIGANATFSITGGQFAIDAFLRPSSALYNFGQVNVAAGATLSFGDTAGLVSTFGGLWNSGVVAMSGTMLINAPAFGLFGSGFLNLTGGKILGATSAVQRFVNHASTIRGFGAIGQNANLSFVNGQGGVVDSNTAAALTLNTGTNTIYNAGTIRTDGAGGLNILSNVQQDGQLLAMGTGALKITAAYVHGGGSLTVAAGGTTVLRFGQIALGGVMSIAGKLTTSTGDLAAVGPTNTYVGDVLSSGDVEDGGAVVVADNSLLNLNATVYGAGEIDLNASAGPATLEIFATGSTLYQSGGVVMSDNVGNRIFANGATAQLSNSTKISGAGTIGDGWLRLVNSVAGSVAATGTNRLTITGDGKAVAAGGKENFNGGAISSTGAGGLLFNGGTLNNSGYVTQNGSGAMTMLKFAIDAGGGFVQVTSGRLVLSGNSSISNQAGVVVGSAGVLTTTAGDTADTLSGNMTNAGQIVAAANSTLVAQGHWTNAKWIVVGSATAGATVSVQAGSTLQLLGAGGSVLMNNVNDKIVSAGPAAKLENKTNLIAGAGVIGDANMTLSNEVGGIIDATKTGGITLNAAAESGGSTFLYNAGTIRADVADGVTIASGLYSPGQLIANAGSKIVAQGNVYGAGTATINGAASIEFSAIDQNDVYFGPVGGGSLIIDHTPQFGGDIFGLKSGDAIDLRDYAFVSGMTGIDVTQSVFGDASASIVLVNGTTSSVVIHLEGQYTRTAFQVLADGAPSGGTLLKLS